MKRIILALAMAVPSVASANPYFRLLDTNHIQADALSLYRVSDFSFVGAVTDIAIITHSTADGTIMPKFLQDRGIAPEPWVPLQIGVGGSVTGNLRGHIGSSFNVSQFAAQSIIGFCGINPSGTGKQVADFFGQGLNLGGSTLGFAAGIGIDAQIISEGHFQSFRGMFPYRGLGANLYNNADYSLGLAWKIL